MVSIGASDKSFVQNKKYVFIHWVSPEAEAQTMVSEIKKRGYKKLAMISHEQEGAIALEDAFVSEINKQGLGSNLLLKERVLRDVRDFKYFITKLRSKNIDGVSVCLLPGGLAAFAKQARDLGLKADLFGFELFEDANEVKASDGALVGKWYINSDDATDDFQKLYFAKYQEEPGWAAANAYDTLSLIAAAVDKVGKDNLKIAGYLRNIKDYRGATGAYSATSDNRFNLPAAVKIVTKAGFKKL